MRSLNLAALMVVGVTFGLLLLFASGEVFFTKSLSDELPPCMEIGEPFHHRFRPNCAGELATPSGSVPFSVNEDGLRERPRAQIMLRPRRVLVAGDSFVEGWWVSGEQALSSQLSAALPPFYFINAGLRSTGPIMQAARLGSLLEVYRPELLLWVLNETDGLDDRFACSVMKDSRTPLAQFGAPEFGLHGWRKPIAELLGNTNTGQRVRKAAYLAEWERLVQSEAAGACGACRGVREFRRTAEAAKVPIFVVYLAKGFPDPGRHYAKGRPPKEELLDCLAKEKLSPYLAAVEGENYFWEGDFHLNPEGLSYLAASLTGPLAAQLKKVEAENVRKSSR